MSNDTAPYKWPDPVVEWAATSIIDVNAPSEWVKKLVGQMLQVNLPLERVRILHQILHPQLSGISYYWTRASSDVVVNKATQGLLERDSYLLSPFHPVCNGATTIIRRHLTLSSEPLDFPILSELKAQGMTDYLVLPLNFSEGEIGAISLATNRASGFTELEVKRIQQIVRAATRGLEILIRHETALSLICAYLGNTTGKRVLSGMVQRGEGEAIDAIIWFSDLRNSTRLSEKLPPDEYLALLNQYFDCLAGAVLNQGGEVLRFIGDAVLAIFPVDKQNFANWEAACKRTLLAVKDAELRIAVLNEIRAKDSLPPISYGIGLHSGPVYYGNIGTSGRVEFTVVGKAANEAAKLESLCKQLNQKVIISEPLTQYHQGPWIDLGKHQIPGTNTEISLFTC
ncbi:adenylate/guanylate cyclase domain-containing protein [Endozoicomonas sp. SM1973]|uniref:Adenylate/guanylate cyclase domain-containing protein n=1 Tax=Spartinivicinus marinus TaxID=2994442 RepID=A0A853I1Y5_9GAMM|nr:adenylate/guanylate cyclase domain-containing protein [Spartinivicinus marinus]MCX4027270.1 adenylate/guanylate cyclase domain-containing protein [Spartinivicinus marinus]NYZ67970.1 adenylate/guanylate cyclase domain-containing protein [Spartinivicinus marinus]